MDNAHEIQMDQPEGEEILVHAEPRKKRTGLWIGIGVALVVVLAAAAYVGGRLMNRPAESGGPQMVLEGPGGGKAMAGGSGPALSANGVQMRMEPAEELPQTPPDAMGMLTSRDDNTIILSTSGGGPVGIMVSKDGETKVDMGDKGPDVEVVITKDTKIYRDVTGAPGAPGDAPAVIQQKVQEITVDDLSDSGLISVWGRKQGDRLIADVVFFMGG